jgi:HTH-type transcriptional regulator / antitoxin HipB
MMDLARNPDQLGSIIRRARKALGWSQTRLGDKVGLGQDTISLLETGNSAAKLSTVLAVLAALDLEIRIAPRTKGSAADIEDLF